MLVCRGWCQGHGGPPFFPLGPTKATSVSDGVIMMVVMMMMMMMMMKVITTTTTMIMVMMMMMMSQGATAAGACPPTDASRPLSAISGGAHWNSPIRHGGYDDGVGGGGDDDDDDDDDGDAPAYGERRWWFPLSRLKLTTPLTYS
jgi:hypothetical protein